MDRPVGGRHFEQVAGPTDRTAFVRDGYLPRRLHLGAGAPGLIKWRSGGGTAFQSQSRTRDRTQACRQPSQTGSPDVQ
jgi:hypothetical protein